MSAAALRSYPGRRRGAGATLDLLNEVPRRFAANDVTRAMLPFEEELLRQRVRRALAERVASRALPVVGEALLVADAAELIYNITTPGEPIPRDPYNAQDMALTIPSNWVRHPADAASYWDAYQTRDGSTGFHEGLCGSSGAYWTNAVWSADDQVITADELVERQFSPFMICSGFDAQGHSGWTRYATEEWVEKVAEGDPITFTNPQRLADPVVATVVLSEAALAPRLRWREMPHQARSPQDEVGPAPEYLAPPLEIVPPTIVVGDPDVGGEVSPSPQPGSVDIPGVGTVPSSDSPAPRGRPPRATKERKVRLRLPGGVAGAIRVVEFVPEILDAVNALWNKALPNECKTGMKQSRSGKWYRAYRSNQKQRIADVYRCWGHIDIEKAVKALLSNQLQDRFYGMQGRLLRNAHLNAVDAGASGRPVGFQAGPWDTHVGDDLSAYADANGLRHVSTSVDFDGVVDAAEDALEKAFGWL